MRAAGGREKKKPAAHISLIKANQRRAFCVRALDLIPPSAVLLENCTARHAERECQKHRYTHSCKKINRQFFLMKFRAQFEYGANKLIGT